MTETLAETNDAPAHATRRKWPLLILAVAALVMAFVVYDFIIPNIAFAKMRDVVEQEVHKGDPWAEAEQKLKLRSYSARHSGSAPGFTLYSITTPHQGGYRLWRLYAEIWFRLRNRGIHIPTYRGMLAPEVWVDTTGTVIKVVPAP